MKPNIYEKCPEFETNSFRLRLVNLEDAKDLLTCYSDPNAVARMNADNCTSNFYFTTEDEMKKYIEFWLSTYRNKGFVRLAIIPKAEIDAEHAIGTIELFGGEYGVLRIDLATEWEQSRYIEEIIKLVIDRLVGILQVKKLVIKESNVPERREVFQKFGFISSSFRNGGYVEWIRPLYFKRELGFAVCGLACCVCKENNSCAGCRTGGCPDREWCKAYGCWSEKGKNDCTLCEEYPCEFLILHKNKVKGMHHFIKEHGEDALLECLCRNEKQGINYHYYGEFVGDYDCATEEETYELLLNGWQ